MASGKSTVARRFEERGAVRIDGDALGWERFGIRRFAPESRRRFGREVLGRPEKWIGAPRRAGLPRAARDERLNAIVQPPLRERVLAAIAAVEGERTAGAGGQRGTRRGVLDGRSHQHLGARERAGRRRGGDRLRADPNRAAPTPGRATEEEAAARVRGQKLPPLGPAARTCGSRTKETKRRSSRPRTKSGTRSRTWRKDATTLRKGRDGWI